MKDGRYQVSLPWRHCHEPLPTNNELSLKRLQGLLCRLKQDPEILAEYDKTIRDQLTMEVIEKVSPEDKGVPGKVHYILYHAVVRRDKEITKVQVVFDASARTIGLFLNNCLHTGPKFSQKILEIYSSDLGMMADIEKVIAVDPEDRDVLRFLWVKDLDAEGPEIITYWFSRVVFGVSSSSFLLNATIQHHVQLYVKEQPLLVDKVLESIYVDHVIGGADSEEEAYHFYKESKKLLREPGSFNLRKFFNKFISFARES